MNKCIDLFSGCGGLSLGFSNAGFDVVAAIDNWDDAINVYKKNFNHPCYLLDLSNEHTALAIIKKHNPDMIIGGPPCQDFSSAGKRNETLGRADLTLNYANIITSYKPLFFVMENVERIKKSMILKKIISHFIDSGYGLSSAILDASYCGVPQARKRFFLIGQLGGVHNALTNIYKKNMTKNQMTIRDYLGNTLGCDFYYRHPRNYSRRGVFSIDEPSPTVRGVNRPVPNGYKKHHADPRDVNLKKVRPLTTIERSYIQTFPFDFLWEGSKTSLEQMIGNAVPVKLAEFVANGLRELTDKANVVRHSNGLFEEDTFELANEVLKKSALNPSLFALRE